MNINSVLAGFIGGLICSSIFFLLRRAMTIPQMLKEEKLKDLSYYGRNSARQQLGKK